LLINVWTNRTTGVVAKVQDNTVKVNLKLPVANVKGERVAISTREGNRWKLSGWGEII